jgi:hypothetical protein
VGDFLDTRLKSHGFLLSGGNFSTFDLPGASQLSVRGINDEGQIVGDFVDATGNGSHGFVATPAPEPDTLALFGSSLAGLMLWRWRSRTTASKMVRVAVLS